MAEATESRCEFCGNSLSEALQKAMYCPNNARQHHTCVSCVEIGKQAGLSFGEIMVMSREAYNRALKKRAEDDAQKVVKVDFKNRKKK